MHVVLEIRQSIGNGGETGFILWERANFLYATYALGIATVFFSYIRQIEKHGLAACQKQAAYK